MRKGRPDIRCDAHREVKRIVPPQRRAKHDEVEIVDEPVKKGKSVRRHRKQ